MEETLFPVDFDVDSSLGIEVTLTNKHQFVIPGKKYPQVSENMTEADFQNWKISYLQEYLADRSINKFGNKDVLVKNAYGAYCLNLPVTATEYLEEQEEIKKNYKEKLILENGLVILPDPVTLQDGWYSVPLKIYQTLFRPRSQNSLVRVISRGFRSVGRLVDLLFLEIFGILKGNFSYFIESIYSTYKMICTLYGTSRTVNFWDSVPSKKIIYRRGIFPISFPNLGM